MKIFIDTCSVDGCEKPPHAKGYCPRHYYRVNRYGDPHGGGSEHHRALKPHDGRVTSNGYRKVRDESGRWVLEHRLVMERALERPLFPDENVHHMDGNKLNNDLTNLELWVRPQPQGIRVEAALEWAHEIIERYS